ncbi:STAS domain-containing protein [Thalassotalea eurytherma]|uniref:RsbT co-antagonist protein RsbRA n=1 Tax=Thalassotalea eurytherma TaxID=1144278 RepID=A0ABQ6H9F6_9GAMM|nr:STAS domain-containing protein [Thalassotalea eurytherma]GLX83402.1 RsbT co-antagonist protein RsbRA [Thalassotalea eurytherma]
MKNFEKIKALVHKNKENIINHWVTAVTSNSSIDKTREFDDCSTILELVLQSIEHDYNNISASQSYSLLEKELHSFASFRALNNFTPTQTANYLLEFKRTIYTFVSDSAREALAEEFIDFNNLIDDLAVLTFQIYTDAREETIVSQAYALEHDTPIVKISQSLLLMPLMGIIDTARAQKIIESLLDAVVENQAEIAILDMTAVATFDTHVANNILKTISAAKMVGTKVILSGISPNAAMTIVKLGVDLSQVETFNTLENAISHANERDGLSLREAS